MTSWSGKRHRERPGHGGGQGTGVVRTLWRLARTFLDRRDLFDERLRGASPACWPSCPSSASPGGWLDERGAIPKAAKQARRLTA